MTDHYRRWSETECVRSFAGKTLAEFFDSERQLLASILPGVSSVLDVGCASGRYVDLLVSLRPELSHTIDFHGIDVSADNVRSAQSLYPRHHFQVANGLDFDPGRRFDLVNATGVCQHEPRFETLIERMVGWSEKYVLFDVKFAAVDDHVADITRSFAGGESSRLYFVLLNYGRFLTLLRGLDDVATIRIFGYETPLNRRTTVPPEALPIVSAGVLLTKGTPPGEVTVDSNVPADRLTR